MIKSRKLTNDDLFGQTIKYEKSPTDEIQKYKNREFGAKKRIKP